MRVGLTGGVGSGKSTVARLLAGHGAVVIDADAIAREVVEPDTPGYDAVVAHFGDVVVADGRLDRPALAAIVFNDETQREALNAIVHPLVGQRMGELMQSAPEGAVAVWDIPLLVENNGAGGFEFVVVVEAPVEIRLARLAARGMAEQDARERMAVQASDEQRRAVADVVITNDGTLDELAAQVDAVWAALQRRRSAGDAPDR
jgi:dephospho-CoA kinase